MDVFTKTINLKVEIHFLLFRFAVNTMCLSQLLPSEVQVLIAQLISQLSLSEITVQGRTNIGKLVSKLSPIENVVQRENQGDFTGSSISVF